MDKRDDRELVRRCIARDLKAWVEFIDTYSGLIFWAIKRKLNKYDYTYLESEAEEIYQLLFTSIWEKKSLVSVKERTNIAPWLLVVASNFTINFIRKKRSEENALKTLRENAPSDSNAEIPLEDRYDVKLANEALRTLNDKERKYLELSYISGKKHKEIAGIFNTSVNSVSTIISRAKKKIKKYIEFKKI